MDALTIRRMRGQVPVQPAAVKTSKAAPSTAAQRTARPRQAAQRRQHWKLPMTLRRAHSKEAVL